MSDPSTTGTVEQVEAVELTGMEIPVGSKDRLRKSIHSSDFIYKQLKKKLVKILDSVDFLSRSLVSTESTGFRSDLFLRSYFKV